MYVISTFESLRKGTIEMYYCYVINLYYFLIKDAPLFFFCLYLISW